MAAPKTDTNSESLVGLYTMYYRIAEVGNHLISKNFRFNGNLQKARERAEAHCKIMNARINFVQPMISDLDAEESFRLHASGGVLDREKENTQSGLQQNESLGVSGSV